MEKIKLKSGQNVFFTGKRGANYLVCSVAGHIEVERKYTERKQTGGFRQVGKFVEPTKEILDRFEAVDERL